MSKIEDLNIQPKFDNALQVTRTASIPDNEKYKASEWNALISKTNEVVGRANLNTWDIVTNYSELPTDPVNGQKVYVTGSGLTGHVGVQMMVNGKSSRGFYVYDAFSDLWVQKTSESAGGGEIQNLPTVADQSFFETANSGIYYSADNDVFSDLNFNGFVKVSEWQYDLRTIEVTGWFDNYGYFMSNYYNLIDNQDTTFTLNYIGDALTLNNFAHNGVTPTVTASVVTSYDIDPQTATEHWNLTMTGDTDFDFTNMFASGNSKVITITLEGDYAFTFPSWLKSLETNDDYDTIGGTLAAEIVINIKNGGATPSGYYSLQMIDYAL